ncbi:MAG: helix-turn-helix transcriptional regulator [Lachnospiraceae bacterium]|nr:helix-turn-helix transcriptional regulator [Lachnospiraceae bacterium]
MNKTYDRLAVGERLRLKRTALGLTQDEMAERIGRVPKYYADIERGNCGMSIETLLALSSTLNMSLDYIIFGPKSDEQQARHEDELHAIIEMLDHASDRKRTYALRLLQLFLIACDS